MKRNNLVLFIIVSLVILAFSLSGCLAGLLSPKNQPSPTSDRTTRSTDGQICGVPTTVRLIAGKQIEAGSVTVWNDATTLYVKYSTTGGWTLK